MMSESEAGTSLGRIEVAPEVLLMIARAAIDGIDGVIDLIPAPPEVGRLFRRQPGTDGIEFSMNEGQLTFDVYVRMDPNVNILETSRAVQASVIEAVDKMVGVPVEAVNVHVEDVVYKPGNDV